MSWLDIFESFTSGVVEGAANHLATSAWPYGKPVEPGRIERLCAENRWDVDERSGESILLYFNDPLVGRRKVLITNGNGMVVIFSAVSHAINPASRIPEQVPASLLMRNAQMDLGAWEAFVDKDGDVIFRVSYGALGAGLDGAMFKFICEKLANEALAIDRKMQAAGLLAAK